MKRSYASGSFTYYSISTEQGFKFKKYISHLSRWLFFFNTPESKRWLGAPGESLLWVQRNPMVSAWTATAEPFNDHLNKTKMKNRFPRHLHVSAAITWSDLKEITEDKWNNKQKKFFAPLKTLSQAKLLTTLPKMNSKSVSVSQLHLWNPTLANFTRVECSVEKVKKILQQSV